MSLIWQVMKLQGGGTCPKGWGHSPLFNLSMGSATSHSCGSREKPVPQHASTAMMDYFPQNIIQINPFSTLSGFLRNPVSNEEGKWYKATHFAMLASNCCMKVNLLPQPPKPMGLQHMCLLLAKIIMTLLFFQLYVYAVCIYVCVCTHACSGSNKPKASFTSPLVLIFSIVCTCLCIYMYVCVQWQR